MDDLIDYLGLICSDVDQISERGCQMFLVKSITNPEAILQSISEIKIVISSLCAFNHPKWASVSFVLLAISNAVRLTENIPTETLISLINLSQLISNAYIRTTSSDSIFVPNMYPFIQAMNSRQNMQLNIDLLLAISDHCTTGFIDSVSLVPALVSHFDQIYEIVGTCDQSHYSKLCDPISSSDLDVILFYTTLWACLMYALLESPAALQAVSKHANQLLNLINQNEPPFLAPAQFLIDCIKSSINERPALKQDAYNHFGQFKTVLIAAHNSLNPVEVEEPEKFEAPVAKAPEYIVHKTKVEVFTKKVMKSKWSVMTLMLDEETKIVMWSENENIISKGCAVHISDINSVAVVDGTKEKKKIDKQFLLRLTLKDATVLNFAFNSSNEANQWKNVVQQHLPK